MEELYKYYNLDGFGIVEIYKKNFNFMKKIPNIFILDIMAGPLVNSFIQNGKEYKIFGAHDSDGLKMLKNKIKILFITSDKRGFKISYQRITKDLGFKILILDEKIRYDYLKKVWIKNFIYMGDGFYDAKILKECCFGISPKMQELEKKFKLLPSKSGEGVVLEAYIKIEKNSLEMQYEE